MRPFGDLIGVCFAWTRVALYFSYTGLRILSSSLSLSLSSSLCYYTSKPYSLRIIPGERQKQSFAVFKTAVQETEFDKERFGIDLKPPQNVAQRAEFAQETN